MENSSRVNFRDRQPDSKLGPAGLRFEVDSAVVVSDEAPCDVEPEARSLSLGFGCKERIEDAIANAPSESRGPSSTIRTTTLLLLASRKHLYPASVRDSVQSIVDQVSPYLVQFAGKAAHL